MRMSLFQMLATGYQAQKEGAMERSVERRGIPHSFGKTANKWGKPQWELWPCTGAPGTTRQRRCRTTTYCGFMKTVKTTIGC